MKIYIEKITVELDEKEMSTLLQYADEQTNVEKIKAVCHEVVEENEKLFIKTLRKGLAKPSVDSHTRAEL